MYYSLIEVPLSRKLPNIFFDGYKSHGQQFHWLIDPRQIDSLEDDFDNYFITYFPEHYHVDARSIIGPEVMQAMIDIYPADIEIYGDSLFIYSALVPVGQIERFTKKALRIRDVMMDNAEYYEDTLRESGQDRKAIAVHGAKLNKRNVFPWSITLIFAFYAVIFATSVPLSKSPQVIILISVYVAIIIWQIARWYRERRQQYNRRNRLYQKLGKLREQNLR